MKAAQNSSLPNCPYCYSSVHVIKKGVAERKWGYKQVYFCKNCRKRFCERKKGFEELQEDVVEAYLFDVRSLDSLIQSKKLQISRTTLYRKIRKQASKCPDWPELLSALKDDGAVGSFMGVDTTNCKIGTRNYVYFHAVDITTGNPIVYTLCERKDLTTIEPLLQKLKCKGYYPKVVVTDLAPELIAAIKKVFPDTKIQGCLFHLKMRLDKELPTKKRITGIDNQTLELWQGIKNLILSVAYSKDRETRREYLTKLNNLNLDEKANGVVKRFFENIVYYNTLDTLKDYTNDINKLIYNNTCESHMRLIKDLKGKMKGFKNIDSANGYIKLYWFYYIQRKKQGSCFPEDKIKQSYTPPLPLFDRVNLKEFSMISGFPQKVIENAMRKKGYEIVDDYAFTKEQLEEIKKEVIKRKKANLIDVAKTLGYDPWTMLGILQKIGIKISCNKIDLSDAKIAL